MSCSVSLFSEESSWAHVLVLAESEGRLVVASDVLSIKMEWQTIAKTVHCGGIFDSYLHGVVCPH